MTEKITQTKHIRQQLEKLHHQKYNDAKLPKPKSKIYKGLGLNWRDTVILFLVLFFVGLYQVQAHAQPENLNKKPLKIKVEPSLLSSFPYGALNK